MTWGLASIRSAYFKGIDLGASHMIVSHNTVDFDQMATYVMPGQDPRGVFRASDAYRSGYTVIDECYRYELGWEFQSKEPRARHWEWEPVKPKAQATALRGALAVVTQRVRLETGVLLRTDQPDGELDTFVSLEALEELSETESWGEHIINLTTAQQSALEAAGWARQATRGGVYATEAFRAPEGERSTLGEILDTAQALWDLNEKNRAHSIWTALGESEREAIRKIVDQEWSE